MPNEYASVYVLDVPFCIDRAYDYFIPVDMRGSVKKGCFVIIPFGTGNKRHMALVSALKNTCEYNEVKPVLSVCPEDVCLSEEMVGLCGFMKEMTLCTYGDAIHAMLPGAVLSRFEEFFLPTAKSLPSNPKGLGTQALFVYQYISEKKRVSSGALRARFGTSCAEPIKKLCEGGYIAREMEVKNAQVGEEKQMISLAPDAQERKALLLDKAGNPRSPGQWSIFATLEENGEMDSSELLKAAKATRPQLSSLLSKGFLEIRKEIRMRTALPVDVVPSNKDIELNDEQSKAYESLAALLRAGEPAGALLYGVTGSGKTSVMLRTIDYARSLGKSVIVLLPEIALTPQTLGIFCSRYGESVAVIHSGLSQGERIDTYARIREGKADVVVGTRSAVFAPLSNLGLIILDEEQEHTYKSDQNPKYHARDIARYRCAAQKAVMLLASATPSVESFKKAMDGTYTLLTLQNRYGQAVLPTVEVEDMRVETRAGNISPIGSRLARQLLDTVKNKEQSILFLNRRGYNNFVSCRTCGKALSCPRCSVSLTYHTKKGSYNEGTLVCHFCGMRVPVPKTCPECGGEHLSFVGYGTQRLERELSEMMPDAKVLRMDTDSTATKLSYSEILGSFRRHEADVLLGTQMVTKGHDFPDVTLVGVLLADASLYLDDYRASERTFALLTQVIGRAGRADKPGRAIIQTTNPDNEIIKLACEQNYMGFYEREIKLRKLLVFPPFCDIVLFHIVSDNENELALASKRFSDEFRIRAHKDYPDMPFVVFGPFEAPVFRVDGKYRMRMVVKCRLNRKSRAFFASLLEKFGKESGKTTLSIDLNPTNL